MAREGVAELDIALEDLPFMFCQIRESQIITLDNINICSRTRFHLQLRWYTSTA